MSVYSQPNPYPLPQALPAVATPALPALPVTPTLNAGVSSTNTSPTPSVEMWQAYQPSFIQGGFSQPQPALPPAYQPDTPTLLAIQRLPGGTTMPPELVQALLTMKDIQPFPGMANYTRSLGIDVIFKNGAEALQHILNNNIRVAFGDMGETTAHAEWHTDTNTIIINQKYRGDISPTMVYALSESIFHEAGHAARNGDGQSSIQEETNCLFLNAWANYVHQQADPAYANNTKQSPLLQNGVALYTNLFFHDPDPEKKALVRRIALKYGVLPIYSPEHGAQRAEKVPVPNNLNPGWWMGLPSLASRVVSYVHDSNAAAQGYGPPVTR